MRRAVDAIFFGGHENIRSGRLCLVSDALKLERPIGMVVVKRPPENDFKTERLQCSPKVFRVAQTAKCRDLKASQASDIRSGPIVAPVARQRAGAENRSAGVMFVKTRADGSVTEIFVGASDYERVGAT